MSNPSPSPKLSFRSRVATVVRRSSFGLEAQPRPEPRTSLSDPSTKGSNPKVGTALEPPNHPRSLSRKQSRPSFAGTVSESVKGSQQPLSRQISRRPSKAPLTPSEKKVPPMQVISDVRELPLLGPSVLTTSHPEDHSPWASVITGNDNPSSQPRTPPNPPRTLSSKQSYSSFAGTVFESTNGSQQSLTPAPMPVVSPKPTSAGSEDTETGRDSQLDLATSHFSDGGSGELP